MNAGEPLGHFIMARLQPSRVGVCLPKKRGRAPITVYLQLFQSIASVFWERRPHDLRGLANRGVSVMNGSRIRQSCSSHNCEKWPDSIRWASIPLLPPILAAIVAVGGVTLSPLAVRADTDSITTVTGTAIDSCPTAMRHVDEALHAFNDKTISLSEFGDDMAGVLSELNDCGESQSMGSAEADSVAFAYFETATFWELAYGSSAVSIPNVCYADFLRGLRYAKGLTADGTFDSKLAAQEYLKIADSKLFGLVSILLKYQEPLRVGKCRRQ